MPAPTRTPPPLRYPADLPITERRQDLLEAIADHQVVVVAGETGSGKSTQLPKLCLELGRGAAGLIGHTQPRRIAARSVAERIAEELGEDVGATVGYAVRFDDRVGDRTMVKVMTDGILLAEIQRDPKLGRYDTIIIDEAHERSLNIDFLLGYLTRLLPQRPDLKLIVTSATIDTERFAAHFDAPAIEVSGRTFPVQVRYRPYGAANDSDPDDRRDQTDAVCDAVTELWRERAHDALVFLSGEREIRDTVEALRGLELPDTEVLPLYARLSSAEQHRIFRPGRARRVIVSTNVAETSLTVPRIRSVVDAGTARISRYSRRLKVQRLPIEPISQASADQRAGRCGRIAPGVAVRLYSEEDFDQRLEYTEPEILRTNLASVILQMASLRLGAVDDFPFIDPPDRRAVIDGIRLLEELRALRPGDDDLDRRLTGLGRRLARLPVDPRLGRMILEAQTEGCVAEVLVIAAAMAIQDPRERPADQREAADAAHARFHQERSDFLAYLELWEHVARQRRGRSGNAFRRMCRDEFIHYLRVREWQDLVRQLRRVARDLDVEVTSRRGDHDAIHRSVLSGLLSHVGMRDGERSEYRGARDARFALARGSALGASTPRWVMAGELVETNRLWARRVAPIRPEWAERLGRHLVKRSHGEPWWDPGRGAAVCTERVTLYGLPLIADRTINLGRVDPAEARRLFIDHALVEGDLTDEPPALVAANHEVLREAQKVAHRARRGDLGVDEHALFAFYDGQLGADVTSMGHFNRWYKQARRHDPGVLSLDLDTLMARLEAQVDLSAFPSAWVVDDLDGLELPITYEFDPSSPTDGAMVHVPVDVLHQLDPEPFMWGVPGFREELVEALLRSLPKEVRRRLVPIAGRAEAFIGSHGPDDGDLLALLAGFVRDQVGGVLSARDFQLSGVPRNLRLTFAAYDDSDTLLAAGKDLRRLQHRLAGDARASVARGAGEWERSAIEDWDFAELPHSVHVDREDRTAVGFPGLFARGNQVALRVFLTAAERDAELRRGVVRLLLIGLGEPRKAVARALPQRASLALAGHARGRLVAVLDDCLEAVVGAEVDAAGVPRTREAFARLAEWARSAVVDRAVQAVTTVAALLQSSARIEARLDELTSPDVRHAAVDVRAQLDRLVAPGFVTSLGVERLAHVDRYLAAILHRLDRLPSRVGADQRATVTVQRLEDELAAVMKRAARPDPLFDEVRWMIEELRVSLFAEHLGTAGKISEKRVRQHLARAAHVSWS